MVLKDECTTIFLNTKGKNKEEVEPELVGFLKFVENSTEEMAVEANDERVQRIYKRMESLKKRAELEANYMKMEERERLMREEAEMRGEIRGKALGEYSKLKSQVSKKRRKGYTAEVIAEILEEDVDTIENIIQELEEDGVN